MAITIHSLPIETVEEILLHTDPLDISSISQCSRFFHLLINHPPDQHLWRNLYLIQPLDDPEKCFSPLGISRLSLGPIDYKSELQAIIRARTVLEKGSSICKPHERVPILRTILNLLLYVPPLQTPADILDAAKLSQNMLWVAAECRKGALLDPGTYDWEPTKEEEQLRARIHTMLGVTPRDWTDDARLDARAYVYNMGNYNWANEFGPFLAEEDAVPGVGDAGANKVDWVHVRNLHLNISMQLLEGFVEDLQGARELMEIFMYPLSFPYTQLIIPPGMNLDTTEDWADVAGEWDVSFCFCDHHLLMNYNHTNDKSLLVPPFFREEFRTMSIRLHVTKVLPSAKHPTRPTIYFGGTIERAGTVMSGSVSLTDDEQVRWRFVSGETGNPIWSGEGVQVGGLRSAFGVLGAWTTIFHDRDDPVGASPSFLSLIPNADVGVLRRTVLVKKAFGDIVNSLCYVFFADV
ncbi:hypothetical protein VNI00_003621 [Paramarasmius palmivorus]|uniref:F-box domain-containing protein n=1 Tax=Paramarasmius palmivorus TaxID=297713 RepID=A0AAW0DS61_9AGAR